MTMTLHVVDVRNEWDHSNTSPVTRGENTAMTDSVWDINYYMFTKITNIIIIIIIIMTIILEIFNKKLA